MSYYKVSTWDPKGWEIGDGYWRYRVRCRKWTIRGVIRRLESLGYDRDVSILVELLDAS